VIALLLASMSAQAAPLEILISDPQIVSVVLECTDGTYRAVVKDGRAVFERKPDNCTVNIIRRAGVIDESAYRRARDAELVLRTPLLAGL